MSISSTMEPTFIEGLPNHLDIGNLHFVSGAPN
jgi:hypothetical protein